ncbi:hypothetical protein [Demequina sp.]|uniref:hypothetical protein n=1 Tax=Demequina sp. TaxID=2050685 RepID=UPI0025C51936|nr:hypothetical protein [Demequina sp.]
MAPRAILEERVRKRSEHEEHHEEHFAGVERVSTHYGVLDPLGFDEAGGRSMCRT